MKWLVNSLGRIQRVGRQSEYLADAGFHQHQFAARHVGGGDEARRGVRQGGAPEAGQARPTGQRW